MVRSELHGHEATIERPFNAHIKATDKEDFLSVRLLLSFLPWSM